MFSKRSLEGWFMSDNRVSQGLPDEMVVPLGLPAGAGRGVFEAPTVTCAHCAAVVIINPKRTRDREYCAKCDKYICDGCGTVAKAPGYSHRSFAQLADMVRSGRFTIVGGSASAPILKPTETLPNG